MGALNFGTLRPVQASNGIALTFRFLIFGILDEIFRYSFGRKT